MEKRIKILYCLTIVAILLFLGMQVYWLYGRYVYSLTEYENTLSHKVDAAIDMYQEIRQYASKTQKSQWKHTVYDLSSREGDTIKTSRTAKVTTHYFKAQELLGLPPNAKLTEEQQRKVQEILLKPELYDIESISRVFDASSAPNESRAWEASSNIHTEENAPFTIQGIDSCLHKTGVTDVRSNLIVTDSMVWNKNFIHHTDAWHPTLTVTFPYSELECKSVEIVCNINPLDVLPGMASTLVMAFILSLFLILCLIWQFSTILKLSRLDKMRNNFVSTMIHELKRPLSTLKMCVSGIENEKMMENPEIKRELMYETRNALDNLSAYFSKLRDITFNNVEQIPLNISTVNIHDIFDSVSKAMVIPNGKSVIFKNEIPEDLIIQGDKSHFTNIVTNLVENAIKYSGDEVTITGKMETTDDAISILIVDNGNGIPNADKQRIFHRFYRGKAAVSELPGMGLGLAYVKLLTEAHGGVIAVESTEGEGSTFIITLPR